MAEYFVGPVMEKLINACLSYLKDQVRWQTGMKEELKKLRKIHPQIKAVVSAYSKAQIDDPELNKWYWQLRDAIDEADDVFDEFEYSKRDKQVSKKRKTNKVRSLMKSLKKRFVKICKRALKTDPNLKRLEVAVQNLYKISAEVSNFLRLLDSTKQEQQQQQLEMRETRETGSMPTNDLVGRSKEMETVRQWLRNPYDQTEMTNTDFYGNISLLSVVGLGGMGKTTLLQHIYEDGVTTEFDVKMWACVSTNFKAKTVIANLLNSAVQITLQSPKIQVPDEEPLEAVRRSLQSLKKQASDEESLEALQRRLKSEVMSKRFLIVLDDIWETDEADEMKWKNVLAPLHHGSLESKILISTRMDSVASMLSKIIKKNKEILPLNGLEEDKCFKLFNIHAFAGVENPDDEFRSIARKMVEKLSGSPLAAKVIGGILNSYVDKSYWKKVLNTNIGNLEASQNGFLPILKLSYIYLPDHLKNCFAFCCMFQQDHQFDKDDLVRMWIALGFIQWSNISGETLQETGRRYFNILVQKSFFDEFRTYAGKVRYKMHDLLHELAQSVSTQECFKVLGNKEFSIPPETIRHLSVNTHYGGLEAVFQKMGKLKNLRSLILSFYNIDKFDENIISEIFKASKSIRLLVISTQFLVEHPERINETIGCLIHLRYLKVTSFSNYLKLPKSISHLYHLQFIISERLQYLERDNIGWKELMPSENCQLIMDELLIKDPSVLLMEPLRSISSFPALKIQENDELVSFPSETEQWFSQHSSSLFRLRFEKLQSLQSLPSSLESLSSLEYLTVENVPQLKLLPSSLSIISSLKLLRLIDIPLLKSLPDLPSSLKFLFLEKLESLQRLPSSLSTLSSLTELSLTNIPLFESLSDLPSSLKILELDELKSLQYLPSCLPTALYKLGINKVPRLLELPVLPSSLRYLELSELESLQCLPSCLPTTLESLSIKKVPRLLELPNLPASFNFLFIEDCHPQLMERYKNVNEAPLICRIM